MSAWECERVWRFCVFVGVDVKYIRHYKRKCKFINVIYCIKENIYWHYFDDEDISSLLETSQYLIKKQYEINEIISTLGFPVAMVLYFIWDKYKVTSNLVQAINNNNKILTMLLTKLDLVEEGLENE